jgi:hypothetical protein
MRGKKKLKGPSHFKAGTLSAALSRKILAEWQGTSIEPTSIRIYHLPLPILLAFSLLSFSQKTMEPSKK